MQKDGLKRNNPNPNLMNGKSVLSVYLQFTINPINNHIDLNKLLRTPQTI